MIPSIFHLLILFQIKHFLCDYPLQNDYMLNKFESGWKFVKPLSAHAAVHAYFTMIISAGFLLFFNKGSFGLIFLLAILDFVIHFIVDRIKASPKLLGRFKTISASDFKSIKQMAAYEGRNGELLLAKNMAVDKLKRNKYFWWSLGADQFLHHCTHYAIIYILIKTIYLGA